MIFTFMQENTEILSFEGFKSEILQAVSAGEFISSLFAVREKTGNMLYCILSDYAIGKINVLRCFCSGGSVIKDSFPSITPECTQLHLFEREIYETHGILPDGHPNLKPIRFYGKTPGDMQWYRIEGDEIHEVAVGPVHAGIIEPGHFRFQCHGENVFNLEISLGYQHRGIEKALLEKPLKRALPYMETAAGDTTIGHATAWCEICENLSASVIPAKPTTPEKAAILRIIMLELERLANHTGDLGALAADIGFLPTSSFCGRIRGDFLNLSAMICGSRFGRGMLKPGGVYFDLDKQDFYEFSKKLDSAFTDVKGAANLMWHNSSVLGRFEVTGKVSKEMALNIGLTGPSARASGIERDVRFNFKNNLSQKIRNIYADTGIATHGHGYVFSRAWVRWLEICSSYKIIKNALARLNEAENEYGDKDRNKDKDWDREDKKIDSGCSMKFMPASICVSIVEGWRGEICHTAITDSDGKLSTYKITDPSFHNWFGLAMAMREQQISDFPLCNKSFNLSYCGFDL
jgi:Ni,Fe-hydrogenase III large subunit